MVGFLGFLIDCALWFVVTAVLVLFLVFLWMVCVCGGLCCYGLIEVWLYFVGLVVVVCCLVDLFGTSCILRVGLLCTCGFLVVVGFI